MQRSTLNRQPSTSLARFDSSRLGSEEEALKKGMEAKSKEFVEKGAELYTKA